MEKPKKTPTKRVVLAIPDGKNGKVLKHDCHVCPLVPPGPQFDWLRLTRPYLFRDGDEVDLPEGLADYFIAAGWAAEPGKEIVRPAVNQPILVTPFSSTHRTTSIDKSVASQAGDEEIKQ